MFRKIHSNRDPRDTLYSELKKQFRPYIGKAGNRVKSVTDKHPKLLFVMMVINLILSTVLSLTVFKRHAAPQKTPVKHMLAPVSDGFDQVMQTAERLREIIRLKKQIDSLSAKKRLSGKDSLALDSALDKFQNLNKPFSHAH